MDVFARRFDSLRADKFDEFSEQEVILSEFLDDFFETQVDNLIVIIIIT